MRSTVGAVVAGILGLEMLASLDGTAETSRHTGAERTAETRGADEADGDNGAGRDAALALFDRARVVGELLDRLRPLAGLLDLASLKAPGPTGKTPDTKGK